jgi:hypothetical protein
MSESLHSNFSSTQTFRRRAHPTLIIQKMQAIKYIKQHNISHQQAHLVHLSYLCGVYHKQAVLISESHGDSNRCTPYRGKPYQHATLFPRVIHI